MVILDSLGLIQPIFVVDNKKWHRSIRLNFLTSISAPILFLIKMLRYELTIRQN